MQHSFPPPRSSDLGHLAADQLADQRIARDGVDELPAVAKVGHITAGVREDDLVELLVDFRLADQAGEGRDAGAGRQHVQALARGQRVEHQRAGRLARSEEHTSELQSLMRISYAVFCLKKKTHPSNKQKELTNSIII